MPSSANILVVGGLVLGIVFLLWRVEVSKRHKVEQQRDIAKTRNEILREIVTLEQEVREVAKIDRPKLKAKIEALEKFLLEAEPGESIEDLFGPKESEKEGGEQ